VAVKVVKREDKRTGVVEKVEVRTTTTTITGPPSNDVMAKETQFM